MEMKTLPKIDMKKEKERQNYFRKSLWERKNKIVKIYTILPMGLKCPKNSGEVKDCI